MADTFTPNYNLVLPGIGGDVNTWGTLLNGNFSAIDTGMAANLDLAGTRPMTGGLKLSLVGPSVQFRDTASTLPAGLFQFIVTGGTFKLVRNTAVAGDFSTSTTPLYSDAADGVHVLGSLAVGAGATIGGNTSVTGNMTATGVVSASPNMVIGGASLANISHIDIINNVRSLSLVTANDGSFSLFDNNTNTNRWTTDTSGNFTTFGNVTAYSDERLKIDWKPLPKDFVETAAQVTTGTYMRKDTGERQAGTIAQEWLSILGEVVGVDSATGMYTMAYGNAALMLAVELAKRVIALEARFLDELK